ncbi:MAG: cytochrome c1 [Pseudomonadota bacterium]|nr:MAG: cytochrome c1 [Pseudomonadota bacterium]
MKRTILLLALVLSPALASAAGAPVKLDQVKIDLGDQKSLQNGARIFVNYCLSCHSAAYMRYNRMGKDLGISEELVKENLLFAADKVGDLMKAVMPAEDAKAVFGVVPPDLTVISRSRGPNWLYTYMRAFYRDDKSYSGWNNTVFPHVAMPHVLYEWQGQQRAVFDKDGKFEKFEVERPGSMSTKDYDAAMRDLTNFLVYLGEPAKLERYRLGVWVILFLLVLLVFAYLLKKEYWKDVH